MALGRRLLVFSAKDPRATRLITSTNDWGCMVKVCTTLDELRADIEGGGYDMVLLEDSNSLRSLIAESDPNGSILNTTLAEVEKRHLLRVLSAAGGNKTRAARILGIDTKTLYNKLKAYSAETKMRMNRVPVPESRHLN